MKNSPQGLQESFLPCLVISEVFRGIQTPDKTPVPETAKEGEGGGSFLPFPNQVKSQRKEVTPAQ